MLTSVVWDYGVPCCTFKKFAVCETPQMDMPGFILFGQDKAPGEALSHDSSGEKIGGRLFKH